MNNSKRYWNRTGYVKIEGFDRDISGLDFRFDVKKVGDIHGTFSVGILGLNTDHIQELTVWKPYDAFSSCRKIEVYAGYEDYQGARKIAEGAIRTAIPTSPPEMWLNCQCCQFLSMKTQVANVGSYSNAELYTIVGKIAEELGVSFSAKDGWRANSVSRTARRSFEISGTRDQLIPAFNKAFNVKAWIEGGVLFVDDLHPEREESPPSMFDTETIDTEHGLLAVGNITTSGATIRTRLNDNYDLNQWVYLKSTLTPKASDYYVVMSKHHVGQLRGNDWYTELTLLRWNTDGRDKQK